MFYEARGIDSLELELQVVRSHLMWVPGIEPGCSGRAVHALTTKPFHQPLFVF